MIPMIMFQMIENPQHTIYRNKNHFEFYSTPRSFLNSEPHSHFGLIKISQILVKLHVNTNAHSI